ncbi:MAG: two-component regulator propeller domain-containing protein, partial [Bacteroidales bacterium]|nr:two-component regulator propeller domain-containing protein [Bacteroidales bacterium]
MRRIRRLSVLVCTIACIFLFPALLNGQGYRFRNYNTSDGLPSTVIYSMIQDDQGYMWIGTGAGLVKFDGFVFSKIPFPDADENRYITCSTKDKNGRLWFGSNDGSVYYASDGSLIQVDVSNSSGIASILTDSDGLIWIIPQKMPVLSLDPGRPSQIAEYTTDGDPLMSAACFSTDGRLLIGTMENIMVCQPSQGALNTAFVIEGFDYARIMSVTQGKSGNEFLIGTDGNGLFSLSLNGSDYDLRRREATPALEYASVSSVIADETGSMWIGTAETGVIRLSGDSEEIINEASGLPGSYVSCMFRDSGNNMWIGFNGQGLSLLGSDAFSYYLPGNATYPENILYVNSFKDDFFLGTPSGYYLFDPHAGPAGNFRDLSSYTGRNDISSYFIDDYNNIWFATRGAGLFSIDGAGRVRQVFRSGDSGENNILHVEVDRDNIWLASLNGLLLLDRESGELRSNYNINKGLPHNYINQITPAGDGSVYVACESERLYSVDPASGIIADDKVIAGNMLNKIMAVMVDRDDNIWAATSGNGAFRISADTVVSFSIADGLMSNYCYSIFASSDGNIWIGHSRGFSVYEPESGLIKVYDTEFARGGDCNADCFYESADGRVFIGTTRGLIVYDRKRENRSNIPPLNNINSITINNVEFPYQPEIVLPYKKNYSVKISFVGIDFSNPEKVFYSTIMENYDADWTEFTTDRDVTYSLRDGRYRFKMVSQSEDGLADENPLTLDLVIRKPFWRSWWFVLSAIFAVAGFFILIVRQREKAQKKIQAYLEQELDARTEVVMKQKSEIELQNMEITDSINYARRIQSSILPDINRLRSFFKG